MTRPRLDPTISLGTIAILLTLVGPVLGFLIAIKSEQAGMAMHLVSIEKSKSDQDAVIADNERRWTAATATLREDIRVIERRYATILRPRHE
jgi:hypothetical protein